MATAAAGRAIRPETIKEKTKGYWTKRAESFGETRHEELHSEQADYWRAEIGGKIMLREGMRVLDAGCGTAYFEAVMAPFGCQVTGVDLTPEMIEKGRDFLKRHHVDADLYVMDAEKLAFPDETFDVVISRNLTWNLPNPQNAYREWYRVLKKGGVLLNFDAEYAKNFYRFDQKKNKAHEKLHKDMIDACSELYQMLPVSTMNRPFWDVEVLRQIGFTDIETDTTVSERIYRTENQFYVPDPMFSVRAGK